MGKAPAFPNASIQIDAFEFLMWSEAMSCEEIGLFTRNLFKELLDGNFEYLESFPFVIRTFKGWKRRKYIKIEIKRKILSAGACKLCGQALFLTIDHIIPASMGGSDEEDNLQCLCWSCNRKKGPEKGKK